MRLYLAGLEGYLTESKYHMDIPSNSYILTSFYYVKDSVIKEIIDSVGIDNVLLDSGAFTFRTRGIKGEDIDSYINKYIDFINKWDIKYFFEMDIDMTEEELPKVKEYRKRIEDATGKKCIPVWHKTRGVNEWKDLCNNYDYIAIGGITSALDDNYAVIIKQLVKYANQHNVKVHGLGYNRKDFLDFDFYSVDATTWNGSRFGFIWYYDRNIGYPRHTTNKKDRRVKSEKQCDIAKHNFNTWYRYQQDIKYRGYWHE